MLLNEYRTIKKSGLFDEHFYLNAYVDVRKSDVDPLKHFCKYGWKEGKNPSDRFDTNSYFEAFPAIKDLEINPLIYYIKQEKKKGRKVNTKDILSVQSQIPSKIKKIISLIKFAKNNPYFVRKFFKEIKINGLKSAINKAKNKIYVLNPISYEPKLTAPEGNKSTLVFPAFDNPEVSIIIPVYNNFDYTYDCLQSIKENTQNISYEIIIGDDNSSDLTTQLYKFAGNITILRDGINRGFLRNCNNAAGHAKGKYILFLNNDTQVQPDWLSSLVDLIESDETIGMVGSKLVYPDGRLQEAGGIIWNDATGWNYGRLDDPMKPEYNYVKEVDYISGASIMIRKSLWLEIGGFDERYVPAYYEDSDLAFEVRKHGYKVVYQPKSVVVHFEGISNGTDVGSGIKQYQVLNHEKFVNKWKDVLEKEHFPNAENVFLARDRSKGKKCILIIDHYVPHFDQDAGSRTMWQYLELLISLNYKVVFIGDNFYKHEPYTSSLEKIGVEVLYGPEVYKNYEQWLEKNCNYFSSVYFLRPHIAIKHIELVRKYNKSAKFIYNGTDFHFLRLEREYELTADKAILKEAKKMKELEYNIFNMVDMVLTISEYEKKYFIEQVPDKNIELIPTFIYDKEFPLSKNDNYITRKDLMFIGGFSHAPNLAGIKWFLENIWDTVKLLLPEVELYIVGSKTPEEIMRYGKNDSKIHIKGFVSDKELALLYDNVKLVIAPLTFGAGVKGKIIESIVHGIPLITTNVGAEGIVENYDVMNISDDAQDFAIKVVELYNSQEQWYAMRSAQISYAQKHFSYSSTKELLKNIF